MQADGARYPVRDRRQGGAHRTDVRGGHAAPQGPRPRRPSTRAGRARSSRRSPQRSRRGTTGRARPGRSAPRSSFALPSSSPGRGAPRSNAATMLGQSKTAHQAEIDAACELIDFWRFNVRYMTRIYEEQPQSSARCLEPARVPAARGLRLRGHAVQLHRDRRQPPGQPGADGRTPWCGSRPRPRPTRLTSSCASCRRRACRTASINLVYGTAPRSATRPWPARTSPASTSPARPRSSTPCGRRSATNIGRYRSYPRIVGETGGKDFIVAHPSADAGRSRDGRRPRLVRVPGPEVLCGVAHLHPRVDLGAHARRARRPRRAS